VGIPLNALNEIVDALAIKKDTGGGHHHRVKLVRRRWASRLWAKTIRLKEERRPSNVLEANVSARSFGRLRGAVASKKGRSSTQSL